MQKPFDSKLKKTTTKTRKQDAFQIKQRKTHVHSRNRGHRNAGEEKARKNSEKEMGLALFLF